MKAKFLVTKLHTKAGLGGAEPGSRLEGLLERSPGSAFERMDGLDDAVIGESGGRLVYSRELVLRVLEADGMSRGDAEEHYPYNVEGANAGPDPRVILVDDSHCPGQWGGVGPLGPPEGINNGVEQPKA